MNNFSTTVPGFLDQCAITFDINQIKQDLIDFTNHFNFNAKAFLESNERGKFSAL